jgi:chemotaxis protein CheY-P-specific phosphatase CheC
MDARVRNQENYIVHILTAGFNRSAQSFSKFVGKNVKVHMAQSIARHFHDFSYLREDAGELYVLTTQLIGDFSGKSYLVLTHEECEEIFNSLHAGLAVGREQVKNAFLLEIDNIISASVISELSNALEIELYGDVPVLKKIQAQDLEALISSDTVSGEMGRALIANTTFQFDNQERVHPRFIWKLSSKVFDVIPQQKISA